MSVKWLCKFPFLSSLGFLDGLETTNDIHCSMAALFENFKEKNCTFFSFFEEVNQHAIFTEVMFLNLSGSILMWLCCRLQRFCYYLGHGVFAHMQQRGWERARSVVTVTGLGPDCGLTVTHGQVLLRVRGNISPGPSLITTGTLPAHRGEAPHRGSQTDGDCRAEHRLVWGDVEGGAGGESEIWNTAQNSPFCFSVPDMRLLHPGFRGELNHLTRLI